MSRSDPHFQASLSASHVVSYSNSIQ